MKLDVCKHLANYRLLLSILALAALLLEWKWIDGGRPSALLDPRDLEPLLGLMLIAGGLGLRSWAAGIVHKNRVLAATGPYSLVRHPLYLGSFIIVLGIASVLEDRLTLALGVVIALLIFTARIVQEERLLAERFGTAWDHWAARTGRMLPAFPLHYVPGVWSYQSWRRNREWWMWVKIILLLALIEAWNAV